tara:strand:+ start:341 stop:1231 length:891 start_codon:yes stop_codon:yes gene_type:complete
MTIPNIPVVGGEGIPLIQINGTGIQFVQTIRPTNTTISPIGVGVIADARVWMQEPPQAIPPTVPVTVLAGTPIVNMPGCVKVHKENVKQRSRNKMLVDDDPKGNTVLCDAGAPYYDPAEYDYRGLSWQTVYNESEEAPEGIDIGDPPTPEIPDAPSPPDTPGETAGKVECPPPNARRIGDLNQAGTEKVSGYELTPDGKICETKWEAISFTEQYLPSVPIVTTTATIAVVATSSALLAKPLADLLLKVIKPVVKKVVAKVKSIMGKKEKVLSVRERMEAQRDRNQAIQTLKKAVKK